jgi:hypothetical protein
MSGSLLSTFPRPRPPLCGIPDGGLQIGNIGDARQSTAAGGITGRTPSTALFRVFIGSTPQILAHSQDTGFTFFSWVRLRAVNRVLCVAKICFIRAAENNKWKIPK